MKNIMASMAVLLQHNLNTLGPEILRVCADNKITRFRSEKISIKYIYSKLLITAFPRTEAPGQMALRWSC